MQFQGFGMFGVDGGDDEGGGGGLLRGIIGNGIHGTFKQTYSCYSTSMMSGSSRDDVDQGGKIIMPPSALEQLSGLNVVYPMMFKLINEEKNRSSHCGVLEFISEEGRVYLPHWIMQNLLIEEGSLIEIQSASLPTGTFAKFQPQSTAFLDISDPKAVLENVLRKMSCLTVGDVVAINYNKKVYELLVQETKPTDAISIIESDLTVEFDAAVGYVEPERVPPRMPSINEHAPIVAETKLNDQSPTFTAFGGTGVRLDGKAKSSKRSKNQLLRNGKNSDVASGSEENSADRNTPKTSLVDMVATPIQYIPGKLVFVESSKLPSPPKLDSDETAESSSPLDPFSGLSGGHTLRRRP